MHPIVTILTIDEINPDKENTLSALLPVATRNRLSRFSHEARRRQTLWGRLIAYSFAIERNLDLIETPPYSPILRKNGVERSLCIAHTGNTVAVGISSSTDPIMGLDIERLREVRSVRDMSNMSFGPSITWASDEYDKNGSLEPFFLLWGMKESEIKLNRGSDRFLLSAPDANIRPDVVDSRTGLPLLVHHEKYKSLRLTVLTSQENPEYRFVRSSNFDLSKLILNEN